ncbi:hypothetical protein [Endozoicomonas lisbonensis]|uniref:hypothetical protein n=1 Tax=Endozoicomonas lisbonensis TaxID=3120522 RepID=UPI003396045B
MLTAITQSFAGGTISTITSHLGGAVVVTQQIPSTASATLTTATQAGVAAPSMSASGYQPGFIGSFVDDLPGIDLDNYFMDESDGAGDPS